MGQTKIPFSAWIGYQKKQTNKTNKNSLLKLDSDIKNKNKQTKFYSQLDSDILNGGNTEEQIRETFFEVNNECKMQNERIHLCNMKDYTYAKWYEHNWKQLFTTCTDATKNERDFADDSDSYMTLGVQAVWWLWDHWQEQISQHQQRDQSVNQFSTSTTRSKYKRNQFLKEMYSN